MQRDNFVMAEETHRLPHLILWTAAAFLLAAVLWASFAEIDEVIVGEGKVIPSNQVQVISNLEGGIVAELLVKVGDRVEKNQPLMRIDDTRFTASSREGKAKDLALLARIARLTAEANGTPFEAPAELEQTAPALVMEEKSLFESRQKDLKNSQEVMKRQDEQRRQELAEMRSRAAQLERSFALVSSELKMTKPLVAKGVVSEVEVLRLDRQANDFKGELNAARLAIPRLEAARREVQQKAEGLVTNFRKEAKTELSLAQGEQSALSAANTALEDRVVRTLVRSPLAGIVKQIKANTIGGVVQPGVDLMEIVPVDDTLLIEAKVRPSDVAFLRPGLDAMVKLSAYDFSIYGGFPATLELISADTLSTDKPNERAETFYQIRVRTKQNHPTGHPDPLPILPGMVATVDIKTGQKTVMHYLLKPIIKTKEMALREK